MKVTNQKTGQDVSSLKNKKSSGVEGLENLGNSKKNQSVSAEMDKASAAKVALSDRAQDMKKIKEIALKTPDVNAEKVKKFQALIDKGEYKIDAGKVADKMVDEQLMMAGLGNEE